MSSVPLHLGVGVARPRAVMDEERRAVAVRDFQQRTHCFEVLAREKEIARYLRADHAGQPERPLKLGSGGGKCPSGAVLRKQRSGRGASCKSRITRR